VCSRSSVGQGPHRAGNGNHQRVNPANPDGVVSLDLSAESARVDRARLFALRQRQGADDRLESTDPIPVHREPIYYPAPDLVADYPTLPDARQFRVPILGFSVQKPAVDRGSSNIPADLSSGSLSNTKVVGRDAVHKWAAELKHTCLSKSILRMRASAESWMAVGLGDRRGE